MERFNESRIKAIDYSGEPMLNPNLQAFQEEITNVLKILSHDLRGSLVSISATLKLLNRGYYGKIDGEVGNKCRELIENVTHLIGMCEESLNRALMAKDRLSFNQELLDLRGDIVHPVLRSHPQSRLIKFALIIESRRFEPLRFPLPKTGSG